MRIGMMTDMYKPNISGVVNYISLCKRHLEAMGHDVFVFTFREEGYQDDESNVIRSPGIPLMETGFYISLGYSQSAKKLLETMDIVHVQHPFISGTIARMYCRPLKIPIVFTNHTRYDLYTHAYLPPVADLIGLAAVKAYLPAFCRECDLVISPSEGMRGVLLKFGVEVPIHVVPNGVDLNPFHEPIDRFSRTELGFSANDVVLTYVGRLGPEKNLIFLLRAFADALQSVSNIKLVLIGGGTERENLNEIIRQLSIANQVRLLGSISYEKLPGYLSMADYFTTASVTEVHPLTIIEAMASGLPCIGINSPGVGDLIVDGSTGLLIDKPDREKFSAGIIRLARDRQLRESMGKNARQAARDYAIERTAALLEECYLGVLSASKKRQRKKGDGQAA